MYRWKNTKCGSFIDFTDLYWLSHLNVCGWKIRRMDAKEKKSHIWVISRRGRMTQRKKKLLYFDEAYISLNISID